MEFTNTTETENGRSVIDFSSVKDEVELLTYEPPPVSAFAAKRACEWIESAKLKPIPNKLFQEFWYESEICFLFADTNVGKSILAVQIANSISNGNAEAAAQKVLYFDFELSEKQFEGRYSDNYTNHYEFNENLYRIELDTDAEQPPQFESQDEWLNSSFEQAIIEIGAKIIIVDNITYLRDENEKGVVAGRLMKLLKRLKKKYGLSILVLGHTPKRDLSKPLSRNDLGGSKRLIDFCDSALCVGESFKDKNLRYIKQIKVREGEFTFTYDNVLVCQIAKDTNFLEFQPIGFSSEKDHLKHLTEKERDNLKDQIGVLSYLPQREIAKRLGISAATVNRYLKSRDDVSE